MCYVETRHQTDENSTVWNEGKRGIFLVPSAALRHVIRIPGPQEPILETRGPDNHYTRFQPLRFEYFKFQ